jgi:hypothetical protein
LNPLTQLSIRPKLPVITTIILAGAVAALGLYWTGAVSIEDRIITIRYFLFALTGLTAFSTPYLLFPDKLASIIQLGNLSRRSLNSYLLKKVFAYTWPVFLLLVVMALGDLNQLLEHLAQKFAYLASALFLFAGVSLFSIVRYVKCGPDSQFWQESEKGKQLRKQMADIFKYPIDPGAIPSLVNTILVLLFGSAAIIAGTLANGWFSPLAETALMLLVFLFGLRTLQKHADSTVRNYYSTNAFFREFFGANLKGEEATSRREVEQLWWVPVRWKMHVWQFLVQSDRKIPAGRVVFAGHLLVLFIAYQRPDPEFLTIIWLIFALLHHLLIVLIFQPEFAPAWVMRWVDSASAWFFSRFWMQLRWVIPLLLGMNVQYFLFATPAPQSQAVVVAIYLAAGMIVSALGVSKITKEIKS